MKLLSSLDRIVPERFLAPVQINELIDYIHSVTSETQDITSKLEDIRNLVNPPRIVAKYGIENGNYYIIKTS